MRDAIAFVLVACLVLAVAKAVTAILLVAMLLALVWRALFRPKEMLCASVCVGLLYLIQQHPIATLSTLSLLAAAVVIQRRR